MELTTVADDEVVLFDGARRIAVDGLTPDTEVRIEGVTTRTLPRPGGELLCRIATVNDVHFGEQVCGHMDGVDIGPVFRTAPGEEPYPEVMNRGAIAGISKVSPDLVVVKGDLTSTGTDHEIDTFRSFYEPAFADRLMVVRGNHESYHGQPFGAVPWQQRVLPGVIVALLDTSVDGSATGDLTEAQIEWLDELGAEADRPVLVMGHHHVWMPDQDERSDRFFGIHPDASERLAEVFARRPRLAAYLAGHTHRNRVRHLPGCGDRPFIEVACVKDYPGTWAEYRVFEGGILQIHRRIDTPDALAWTEQTRHMYEGLYADYALGPVHHRNLLIGGPV